MSTGQGAGATNGDFFDYTGVKSCMDSLDQKFSEFAELLRGVNDYMNDNIHPLDIHIYYTSYLISPKNTNKICILTSLIHFFAKPNCFSD